MTARHCARSYRPLKARRPKVYNPDSRGPTSVSTTCDNPCSTCSIHQDCCTHLSGLRVTKTEFERCFVPHTELLEIEQEGPVLVLTPKNGAACPNWQGGGCAVYENRPRECRLFPFTLFVRKPSDGLVSLGYHSDTNCPLKAMLLPSEAEARAIVASFGEEAFTDAQLQITPESTFEWLRRRTKEAVWKLRCVLRKRA